MNHITNRGSTRLWTNSFTLKQHLCSYLRPWGMDEVVQLTRDDKFATGTYLSSLVWKEIKDTLSRESFTEDCKQLKYDRRWWPRRFRRKCHLLVTSISDRQITFIKSERTNFVRSSFGSREISYSREEGRDEDRGLRTDFSNEKGRRRYLSLQRWTWTGKLSRTTRLQNRSSYNVNFN